MGDNFRFVLTANEALNQLNNFDDNGLWVDVSADNGDGYFPTLTLLGRGDLMSYERDYLSDIRNSYFDLENVNVVLVDTSSSEAFKREFLPMTNELSPDLPNYALSISKLKSMLESLSPDTIILKRKDDKFISPSYLGNYNNETYPFVSKEGKPITAGLKNNQTATFSFVGKRGSILDPFKYEFNGKS
jgi:hypothetical protein